MGKKTRQGVRDLNDIPAPKGRVLDLPEEQMPACNHRHTKQVAGGFVTECTSCGESWDNGED